MSGAKIFEAAPHYSSLPRPLSGGTCPFCHPVEAMHPVTKMSLKTVDTVLTSRQIRQFSPIISFGPKGVKPLKSERAKTYSRPLASKSGGAFALPALQLVPPLLLISYYVTSLGKPLG